MRNPHFRGERMGVSAAVRTFAFAGTALLCAAVDAREAPRFVPQLDLTDLEPRKVAFAPDDATLILVVNQSGRIDLFDISNPGRPVKIAFTPKGTARDKIKIVSGGAHGTVRLWTLDGKPAAEPLKGHRDRVFSVAFPPDSRPR